ncbi:LacI family DNA-binding transcriptional regulator [Alteribacillus sp. YIM 98480]|uniref:LacI family DNA-binding transcriptional regulator n=1 Tax=Alteribacillus sp. YIM 98480 TaxID=2606599 RepID=UPI00131AEA52|nr:LacI family DNA-binding transcriptional regulator [Alteribacillus sp. YIM 98480]
MKITIRDVARLSDVSISTVSRVLNSPGSVKKDKREKVLQTIKELNYHPNALARGLINKRTHSIGVLITDVSNPFVSEVIRGMEEAAHKMGSNLIICNTDQNKEKMIEYLRVLKEKQVDGFVFTSEPVSEEYHEIFQELGLPVVLAATHSLEYDLPSVKVDDEQAVFDAVDFLIKKGHTQIGMISGPTWDPISGTPRLFAFKSAMREKFSRTDFETIVEYGSFTFDSGYTAMKKLHEKNQTITTVFCASDEMALGAMSYLYEKRISVPDDVSVMGFDNTKIAKMCIPKLTTVAQPMYEIGYESVTALEQTLEDGQASQLRKYLTHEIIERESVKDIN